VEIPEQHPNHCAKCMEFRPILITTFIRYLDTAVAQHTTVATAPRVQRLMDTRRVRVRVGVRVIVEVGY
jgi:hypothetical protein